MFKIQPLQACWQLDGQFRSKKTLTAIPQARRRQAMESHEVRASQNDWCDLEQLFLSSSLGLVHYNESIAYLRWVGDDVHEMPCREFSMLGFSGWKLCFRKIYRDVAHDLISK